MSSRVSASPSAASRIPSAVRFPLVCVTSLALSALSYTVIANYAGFELASVSRDVTDNLNVASFVGLRVAALGFAWAAGYDYQDLISLTCLANLPYYYLLVTFYNIHTFAGVAALLVDIFSVAAPFALFRSVIHAHDTTPARDANQIVAQDRSVYGLVGVFGAAIYAIVVYSSFYTWLPKHMILHFDGLRSLEKAHNTGLPILVSMLIPIGLACAHFQFAPAVGSTNSRKEAQSSKTAFDASRATFGETLAWNLGFGKAGWTKRTEILAKRTLILTACLFLNTFLRVWLTIEGSEFVGALGWSAVWATASLLTGFAFGWVGDE